MVHIQTKDLLLARQDADDPEVVAILHDPSILENLAEARSYPAPMPANICFRIEKDGNVIGQACLKGIRWINHKAELSLFIQQEMQGKGFGGQALKSLIDYGFNRLNLYRLEAEVIEGNQASVKLLEENGFVEEGRLREAKFVNGQYKDLLRYGLLKKEFLK